jgi:hypothetical protein
MAPFGRLQRPRRIDGVRPRRHNAAQLLDGSSGGGLDERRLLSGECLRVTFVGIHEDANRRRRELG